jgi:hypothetical protein
MQARHKLLGPWPLLCLPAPSYAILAQGLGMPKDRPVTRLTAKNARDLLPQRAR